MSLTIGAKSWMSIDTGRWKADSPVSHDSEGETSFAEILSADLHCLEGFTEQFKFT